MCLHAVPLYAYSFTLKKGYPESRSKKSMTKDVQNLGVLTLYSAITGFQKTMPQWNVILVGTTQKLIQFCMSFFAIFINNTNLFLKLEFCHRSVEPLWTINKCRFISTALLNISKRQSVGPAEKCLDHYEFCTTVSNNVI